MPFYTVTVTYPPHHAEKPVNKTVCVQAKDITEAVDLTLTQLHLKFNEVIRIWAKQEPQHA